MPTSPLMHTIEHLNYINHYYPLIRDYLIKYKIREASWGGNVYKTKISFGEMKVYKYVCSDFWAFSYYKKITKKDTLSYINLSNI